MNDLISIVVPIYHAEGFVDNIIRDVLSQTYQNWELLLVSNGDKREKQEEICRQYAQQDQRIKLFINEQAGTSRARNKGVENATGRWLTFLDVDDRISPSHLQNYMDAVTDDVDMIIGGFTELSPTGKETIFELERHNSCQEGGAFFEYISSIHTYIQGMTWNKFYKAEVLNKSGIRFHEDIVHIEDIVFNYEMFLYCRSIKTIPMTGYRYIRYSDSTTGRFTPSFEKSFGVLRCLYREICKLAGYSDDKTNQILLRRKYSETYIFIINLFRRDCPICFKDKVKHVKLLLNDKEFINSRRIVSKNEKRVNLRIFDFFLKMRSPLLLSVGYSVLFRMKSVYVYLKRHAQ